jgi:hypothetical protein
MLLRQRWQLATFLYDHSTLARPAGTAAPDGSLWERFCTAMSGFSKAAAAGALNFLSGLEESFAKPVELYLALCTVVPTSSSTGLTITEATGATGYARMKLSGVIAKAVEATKSSITNNAEITGAAITAGSATVEGWAACTSKETGKGAVFSYGTATSTVISATATPPKVAKEGWKTEIE